MQGRFEDRVVFVVGAGSSGEGWGNGKAAAVTYARQGAMVVAADISERAAQETAAIIVSEGGTATSCWIDVTDPQSVSDSVQGVLQTHDHIDVLHNNVGAVTIGDIVELTPEKWNGSMNLNLGSVFLTMKAVLPSMLARGRGSIINISGVAGLRYTGYPYPAYSTAKAGINQLTAVTALQHAKSGVRINAVAPGLIETPLVYQQLSAEYDSIEEMLASRNALSPTGKMGSPWDIANAAAFLASDEAAYITGQCLVVDGGLSLRVM